MGNYRNDIDEAAYDNDTIGDTNNYWGGLADFLRDKRKLAGLTPLGEALARTGAETNAPSPTNSPFVSALSNALSGYNLGASNNSADNFDQRAQRNQIQGYPFGERQAVARDDDTQQSLDMYDTRSNWGAANYPSDNGDDNSGAFMMPVGNNSSKKLRTPVIRANSSRVTAKQNNGNAATQPIKLDVPIDRKTCKGNFEFSAIGPNQALGKGALSLGFKPPNDTVAIDPARFGLPFDTIPEREAAQKLLRDNYGKIQVSAPGLSNHLTGSTTFSISDVGDEIIRNNIIPRFDIYRFVTQKEAEKFGRVKGMETVITGVPATWKCPK
jgi:hypothetical protein